MNQLKLCFVSFLLLEVALLSSCSRIESFDESIYGELSITKVEEIQAIDGYYHLRQNSSTTYAYYYVDDASSVSGTYMGYDVESVYSNLEMESIYPGYCNGCQLTDSAVYNTKYLLMNWGWDGEDDNNHYL